MASQQGLRKALGAIKDSTRVGLAKVNSTYKELDIAVVKATNHVECPPKEEHVRITQAVCMEPGCEEVFDNPQLLRTHTKAAHSFVFCETCGVSMLKKNLVAHARKHGGQELMRCPNPGCLYSYNKKSNLDTHIRAIHMNLKPFGCSHAGCEMRFAYRAVRDKHELCSLHVTPVLQEGNFESEDSKFRLKPRGGRKRLKLNHVDDILPRKYRTQPLE